MFVYNPHSAGIIKERIKLAREILDEIPAKYCFITGSFLYKRKYKDIDVFVITRSKKKIIINNKRAKATVVDFNSLYSLFYHSISKSCVAKDLLPDRPIKATISDYWSIINEAVPTLFNNKNKYYKDVRFLVLYTEYFKSGEVLDSFELDKKINDFNDYKAVLEYIKRNVPEAVNKIINKTYIRRFFYTQAGYYKDLRDYNSQDFLYGLAHEITRGVANG